jgi:hypothetical protein
MALGDFEVKGKLKVVGTTEMTGSIDLNGGALDTALVTNLNADLMDSAHKDTDGTLSGNSDSSIPTEKAIKTYADTLNAAMDAAKVPTTRQIIAGVGLSGGGTLSADRTLTVAIPTLYIEDQKTANTAGGTFTSGAWYKRDLNTVVINEISGASLASSQITLPAGTYEAKFSCPAYTVYSHKAKLYNVTAAADLIIGSSSYATSAGDEESRTFGFGRFVLTVQSILELQHRCNTTRTSYGLGIASNFSVIEVYSMIEIRKIA